MKISLLFLLLQFLILIVVSQPVNKLIDIDNTSGNIVNNQVRRCRRTVRPPTPPCTINQYFDEEEGRCLGIAGGGKALFIDNTRSCGTNVLKPHCTNPKYYYVCKRNKMILVQCTQGYHFENRLQKCVHVGDRPPTSNTVQPNIEMPDSIEVPACQAPGSFPVPGDCALFYTCETTGHRFLQNIFKCPKGMVFDEEIEMCIPSVTCIQLESNLYLPPCTTDAGRNVTVLPDRDETGKIQDSMNREDYSEGKKKSTICETIFTDGYTGDFVTTTNNYEGTETMYDEKTFSTTTLSYTEEWQTPQEFVVSTDNSTDITTSTEGPAETSRSLPAIAATTTVTYSTMIKDDVEGLKEINLSTEMAISESSVETSTVAEVISSEQNDPNVGETEISRTTEETSSTQTGVSEPSFETSTLEEATSSDLNDPIVGEIEIPSTTEGTSSTQTGVSEPSFETSTLEEFTSSDQNDPIVGAIGVSSTTQKSLFTQTGASEPSFETSTLEEFTSSDQNDPIVGAIGVSSTTQESSFTQTGASEPSFETSTLEEFTSSEQNDPIVGAIGVSSTTQETSSTQTGTNGSSLETSTLREFISNKEYKPIGADEGVVNNIEGETTEHLTTETESTESTPTMPLTNLFTSTRSISSNEGMTTESTALLNDAVLFIEDLPDTNEEITKTDVESATDNITTEKNTEITGEMFVPTENTSTSNKIATIDASVSSAEDTNQPSTSRAYKILDTVGETTTTSMESSTEPAVTDELLESGYPENTSPDFTFSTSTTAATLSSTVSVVSFDKINELVGNMEEFRYNSTATPDIASSSEPELMNDISSDTPADVEAYNKTVGQIVQFLNDITLALNAALSAETTVLKDDESSSTAMPDMGALNETVDAIQQLMNNLSSTLNSTTLQKPEVRAKYNEENKALPIYIPIYDYIQKGGNIDNDDKNILANVCAMLTTSPVENITETDTAATRKLSNKLNIDTMSKPKSKESAETAIPSQTTLLRQNESAAKVTDPRRTISKNIVLPLTSSVLNITDKFERRLHGILRNLSKLTIRS